MTELLLTFLPFLMFGTICRAPDDYLVVTEYTLLKESAFNKQDLTEAFASWLEPSAPQESFVIVTSDKALYHSLKYPRWHWVSVHEAFQEVPIWTDQPIAYFFRFDQDSFVQFRDAQGAVGWFTLGGENLFHRTFGQTKITLVGHNFRRWMSETWCREMFRRIILLAEEPRLEDLVAAAKYYDERFPFELAGNLEVYIYSCGDSAVAYSPVAYPGLDTMQAFKDHKEEAARWNARWEHDPTNAPLMPSKDGGWVCFLARGQIFHGLGEHYLLITRDRKKVLSKKAFEW